MSIYLTAIVKSKTDKTAELKDILLNMVSNSRLEEDCIQYDLHESLIENTFIFHEEWADQSSLDAHNQKSYIQSFVKISSELTDSVFIYKTAKIG